MLTIARATHHPFGWVFPGQQAIGSTWNLHLTAEWEGLTPPYSTIVADPPWPYPEGFAGGHSGSRTNPNLPPGPVLTKPPRLGWDSWGHGWEQVT